MSEQDILIALDDIRREILYTAEGAHNEDVNGLCEAFSEISELLKEADRVTEVNR